MSGAFQSTIGNYAERLGAPGSKYGSGHSPAQHKKNDAADVPGVWDLTFTAQNTTAFTFTISGAIITFTSDASGTQQEIRDGLAAAIVAAVAADPNHPAAKVVVSEPVAATLRLTEVSAADPVTVAEADANIALAVVTAHDRAQPMDSGLGVFRGPSFGTIRNTGTAAQFDGIVELGQYHGVELETFDTSYQYPANSQIPVGRNHAYVVSVEDSPAIGDSVFIRVAIGPGGTVLGSFRTDADGGAAVDISAVAQWRDGASNSKAVLEINLP